MPTRSKHELVRIVAKETGRSQAEVGSVLDAVLDQLVKELAAGNEVRFTGYFSLGTKVHKPRKVRHPKTGEPLKVPARTKVTFTSGAKLKRWVETRLASKHFYGKRRETDEIDRGELSVNAQDIAGALGALGGDAPE